jgi:hypothetical protein
MTKRRHPDIVVGGQRLSEAESGLLVIGLSKIIHDKAEPRLRDASVALLEKLVNFS